MLKDIKIKNIKIGERHRKDMGDLTSLAESIRQEGLLQPIGVTDRMEIVFGERRLRAVHDILKRKTILARIVNVSSIVAGEYHENEIRKDFTPSERVAIAKAIERQIGNRRGQRTDRQRVQEIAQVEPGRKTRDQAAERAGFGNHETYRQAAKVIANGTPRLIQAMDEGRVSISAASILADADADEQKAVLELDEKAILQAAKEIRQRQAEQRAVNQEAKTVRPQDRPKRERLRATRLIHGDCRRELTKLPGQSIDLILIDPPYPEIDREYGRMTEQGWHELMRIVVTEGRRVLKPTGSMVVILQPNFEKVGRMRLWLWDFVSWAGREWNLVQDVYWWNFGCLPTFSSNRRHGLLRHSIKMCVWLGAPNCYRNQDNVLWLPSDDNFAESKADSALRYLPSGKHYRGARIADTVAERGGSTPFNLIPVAAGAATTAASNGHPAKTPYDIAAWWVKYLLPPKGVLLDCFAGSGTMLAAGLDFGASKVIGIEQQKKYIKVAQNRIVGGCGGSK
jgi:DNA modification methylase/ParB-like chromosome segregation protein Spo0J